MGCPIRRDRDCNGKLKPHSRCRKWELQVSVNDNGRYSKRSRRFSGTQREARAELARFEVEVAGERQEKCPLCSEWFDAFNGARERTGSVAKTTVRGFDSSKKSFLLVVGDKPLDEVTVSDCCAWRDDMLLTLKPTTVATKMAMLSPAFEDAVRDEKIARNPLRYTKNPKSPKEERKAPGEDEIAHMVSMLSLDDPYERAVLYIVFCGLRRGEVCAIDPHEAIADYMLHVHSNMLDDGEIEDTTKGRKDRYAPIPKFLWDATEVGDGDALLCQLPGGVTMTPRMLGAWWKDNRERLGMGGYRLHDLRHGYVTQLVRNGVSPKVIQDIVGHKSIDITMNVYAHVDNAERHEAAASMEERFAANLRQK